MKVLILGAKGMAGHMISLYLKENTDWDIISWGREEFEVKEEIKWKEKIQEVNSSNQIDCIINCIGILKPVANANPILGVRMNSLFPHELAKLGTELKTKVIHLSSDCWEDLDVYGRSKRAGEIDYPDHLTIRTSIIGPELKNDGSGLFQWFMTQKSEVNGFVNHYWDGVITLELAKMIKSLIEKKSDLTNIIEFRTKNKVSKFELLSYLNETFEKNIKLGKKETEVVDKTNNQADILCELPLDQQIKELKEWMAKHSAIYQQYNS